MENQAALDYIRQCFAEGMDEAAIRQQLLASGWPLALIDQAFWQYNGIAPVPSASAAPVATPAPRPRGGSGPKRLLIAVLVGFVVIVGGLSVWLVLSSKSKPNNNTSGTAKTTTQTKTSTTEKTQATTTKPTPGADIQTIAAQVKQFMSKNNGALPTTTGGEKGKTFQLCGTACDSNAVSVTLQYFDGSGIQMEPYAKTLQVPNEQTVYVVAGASCLADGTGIGTQSAGTQPTMVFLYATTGTGSNFNQHCISL